MGLRANHVCNDERRGRMLFIIAIAQTLLTLLGAASEAAADVLGLFVVIQCDDWVASAKVEGVPW